MLLTKPWMSASPLRPAERFKSRNGRIKMKKTFVCGLLALGLWGCGKDTTGPSGPPDLTMKDVVGCWKYENACQVKCYDRGGGYYDLWVVDQSGIYERFGRYSLSSHFVNLSYRLLSSAGANREGDGMLPYRRIGSTLIDLNSDGSLGNGVWFSVSLDTLTCGTPWNYFTKPAGWDTLVKPY